MIRRMELRNFRRHTDTVLEFTPDEQLIVVSGHNGSGKCLPGDTEVFDADAGIRVPIEEFVANQRPRTIGVVNGAVAVVSVSAWHTLAQRPVVEVRTRAGRRLRAAATHPVLTDDGWKVVGVLAEGSKVAVFDGSMTPAPTARSKGRLLDASGRRCSPRTGVAPVLDVVVSVRPTGERVPMFDLTVDTDEHIYVAGDGFVTHNSTLVSEALLFAFFGESRHGRRRLDELVRRGAELEGVEVAVTFTASGHTWTVERSRVEGIGSARLSMDGTELVDGTSATDAELVRLLGMDAAGFRLAVLARQKELDGLTSLDRSTRRRVLGRLLRIDAVARAASKASDEYSRAAEVLAAFGPAPDTDALAAAAAEAASTAEAAAEARSVAAEAVKSAEVAAAGTVDASERARVAAEALAAARAAAVEARSRAEDLTARAVEARAAADAAGSPALPPVPSVELRAAHAALSERIAAADAARRAAADRDVLASDLEAALAAVEADEEFLARTEGVPADLGTALERARVLRAELSAAREGLDAATAAEARAAGDLERICESLRRAESLGEGVCERCGTPLTEEHLAAHVAELSAERAAAEQVRDAATAARAAAAVSLEELDGSFERCVEEGRSLRSVDNDRGAATSRVAETSRRVSMLRTRLSAPAPELVDVDALSVEMDELSSQISAALDAEEAHLGARRACEVADRVAGEAASASGHAAEKAAEAAGAELGPDLVDARRAHEENVSALAAARDRLADAREEAASAASAAELARRALADATEAVQNRTVREERARVSAHTKRLLRDCHEKLSEGLRPALEASASQLLSQLSEGRFPAVKVTGDYDVLVSDDGEFRALGELSGGETDLVALAVRLALAQVVADRRGSDALGLLVLDEVFGSQDAVRRQSILSALRELRSIYGQIFLISHVGGLEDAADRVVDLELDSERNSVAVDL